MSEQLKKALEKLAGMKYPSVEMILKNLKNEGVFIAPAPWPVCARLTWI